MKSLVVTIMVLLSTSLSFGQSVLKSGSYVVGYDSSTDTVITKALKLDVNTSAKSADLEIEGIAKLKGIAEGSEITAYIPNPTKFFYVKLELKPELKDGYVLLQTDGASSRMCRSGSNALLTLYRGDGKGQKMCAQF